MQDGGTSSIKFHKVLQDKTNVRQIIREKPEELLEQGRKEGKNIFYEKFLIPQISEVSSLFKV